jgi:hypothetical protein
VNGSASGLGAYGGGDPSFRAATPNSRGQYSAAVLDELESQNDEQAGVLSAKVKQLKSVCSNRIRTRKRIDGKGALLMIDIVDCRNWR